MDIGGGAADLKEGGGGEVSGPVKIGGGGMEDIGGGGTTDGGG